jgi:PKD repeat protein
VSYLNATTSTSKNIDVKFNAFGQYSVTLKVTNAIGTDQKTKTNYITVAANANKSLAKSWITLFPNPATDKITVKGIDVIEHVSAIAVNGTTTNLPFSGNEVDLSNLAAGVYFISIKDNVGGLFQAKLMVNP